VTTPRALGRLCEGLFAVSTAFPVVACLLDAASRSRLLGAADITVAVVLLAATFVLVARMNGRVTGDDQRTAFAASQVVLTLVPFLLALYFVVGSRIDWTVLVIGLSWRAWLLISALPSLAAARRDLGAG
jgi:hypothetical protein